MRPTVNIIAVEAAGKGIDTGESAATSALGKEGIIHGSKTLLMQTPDGKITEPEALFELAEAFDGEARPTVMRTQDQVFRLEGTLESQYDTWRDLLRDIYLIETGGQTP